jgi:microcystin-dependent protein
MTATSMGTILPKGKTQFLDGTGAPLAGGTVAFYIPSTTTPLATYQDQALTIANTNPVDLDSNGEAVIWGFGAYRQIVQDVDGNTIWDEVITAPAVPVFGVDSGAVNALVVSIPGVTSLYTGLTLVVIPAYANTLATTIAVSGLAAVSVTQGSSQIPAGAIAAGTAAQMIFDGTNFQLLNTQVPPSAASPGDLKAIAGRTPPSGWDLCYGKTYNRITNSALFAAIGTIWGAGDGATTFLGPDFRGRALFGADAMGGTAANRLTTASLGGSAGAVAGASGGNELVQSHNHTLTVTDPGHAHSIPGNYATASYGAGPYASGGDSEIAIGSATASAMTGISVTEATYGTGNSQNLPPAAVVNICMYVG